MPEFSVRERPKCRKVINELLTEYNCDLNALFVEHQYELSNGLRKQVKLMMLELENQKEGDFNR